MENIVFLLNEGIVKEQADFMKQPKIHYKYRRCVHWQGKEADTEDRTKVTCKRCLARII